MSSETWFEQARQYVRNAEQLHGMDDHEATVQLAQAAEYALKGLQIARDGSHRPGHDLVGHAYEEDIPERFHSLLAYLEQAYSRRYPDEERCKQPLPTPSGCRLLADFVRSNGPRRVAPRYPRSLRERLSAWSRAFLANRNVGWPFDSQQPAVQGYVYGYPSTGGRVQPMESLCVLHCDVLCGVHESEALVSQPKRFAFW